MHKAGSTFYDEADSRSLVTYWRRVVQQTKDGEGRDHSRVRMADHVDVALVKLVMAGAPTQWLWAEPEVIDLGRGSQRRVLEREIEKQSEYSTRSLAVSATARWRASEIWREVERVCREWRRRWLA